MAGETINKSKSRKKTPGSGPNKGARKRKKDDAAILASYHKAKFFEGPTETAKDTLHPMKAQRHFLDSTKYRQKKAALEAYKKGEDKAGNKTSDTKTAKYFRSMSNPKSIKTAKEDFFKPFKEKRMFNKGGRAGYKHGGAAKRGHGCEIK